MLLALAGCREGARLRAEIETERAALAVKRALAEDLVRYRAELAALEAERPAVPTGPPSPATLLAALEGLGVRQVLDAEGGLRGFYLSGEGGPGPALAALDRVAALPFPVAPLELVVGPGAWSLRFETLSVSVPAGAPPSPAAPAPVDTPEVTWPWNEDLAAELAAVRSEHAALDADRESNAELEAARQRLTRRAEHVDRVIGLTGLAAVVVPAVLGGAAPPLTEARVVNAAPQLRIVGRLAPGRTLDDALAALEPVPVTRRRARGEEVDLVVGKK